MAFQQGNLQKALVHEIVLGKQSTFFPTRLSERVVHVQHQPISIHSEPTEEILQRRRKRSYKWQDSKDHQTKPLHDESETMGISIRVWWNTPRRRFSLQHRGTVGRNVFHPRRSRKKFGSPTSWCTTLQDRWKTPYTTDDCYRWRISSGRWVQLGKKITTRQQFEKARYEFVNLCRFLINMEMFFPDCVKELHSLLCCELTDWMRPAEEYFCSHCLLLKLERNSIDGRLKNRSFLFEETLYLIQLYQDRFAEHGHFYV